jgi:hypothetical protein
MSNVNDKKGTGNLQPVCFLCKPGPCDYVGCDKRVKFLERRAQDEEAARLRAELKDFMNFWKGDERGGKVLAKS